LFNVPVCKSFQAKIKDDQLCYEIDLNRFTDKNNVDKDLKLGFYFVMDYNEDRQVNFYESNNLQNMNKGLANSLTEIDQDQHAFIYLNTIEPISLNGGGGQYNLDDLTEVKARFLPWSRSGCQGVSE